EHPRRHEDQRGQRRGRRGQPRLSEMAQPDGAQHEVGHAPVVVVDPEPDDADDRVGHQHRREPDGAEEARERHAAVQQQRERQGQRHVDERRHDAPRPPRAQDYLPRSRASSSLASASSGPMTLFGRPWLTVATYVSHTPGFISRRTCCAVRSTHFVERFTRAYSSKYHLSGLSIFAGSVLMPVCTPVLAIHMLPISTSANASATLTASGRCGLLAATESEPATPRNFWPWPLPSFICGLLSMPSSKSFGWPPLSGGTNARPVYQEPTGNMHAFCSVWK